MKNKQKILGILFSIYLCFFCFISFSKAQEIQLPNMPVFMQDLKTQEDYNKLTLEQKHEIEEFIKSQEAMNTQGVVVATVNIYDTQIISQNKNQIQISFDLSNREYIQPDIRYAVQLVKENQWSQVVLDEKVYPEVVNLNENQTITKKIDYTAPQFLSGEFQIWLIAKNQSGLSLALANLGSINLQGNNQYLEIKPDSCYLKIEGEELQKQYTINQGVDIQLEEKLIAYCEVTNYSNQVLNFTPFFKTNKRTTFGEEIQMNHFNQNTLTLNSQEKKQIDFSLVTPTKPQSYDTTLILQNKEGQAISNPIVFHYVVRWLSATIQNIRLDKEFYQKGDIAKASLFWSASADNFPNSRLSETKNTLMQVNILIQSQDNQICAKTQKELDQNISVIEYTLPIEQNCQNPYVTVSIQDTKNSILDKKEFKIQSQKRLVPIKSSNKIIFISLIVILILLIVFVLLFLFKKQKFLILFILTGSIFFLNSKEVLADTWSFNAGSNLITTTANLNKRIYAPGENITAWTNAWSYPNCGNAPAMNKVFVSFNTTNTLSYTSAYNPINWPAQTTAGGYVANFRTEYQYWILQYLNYAIPYTVTSPPNVPPVGNHESISCSNSIISTSGWGYDPNAPSSSIAIHFYEGSTSGRYLGQCTANQFRSDVNAAFGLSGWHGFSCNLTGITAGNHSVAAYAIDTAGGINPLISNSPKGVYCAPPTPCNLPWGGQIAHGASITAYSNSSVPCGSSCSSQIRTCNNGSLSGSYTNSSCSVQPCLPSCGLISYSPTSWTAGSVTATVQCQDSSSGCRQSTYSQVFSNNGSYSISIYNNANLSQNCPVNIVNIDKNPPTQPGKMTASWQGDHYVKTNFVASTIGSNDTQSGVRWYRLCRSNDNTTGCSAWVGGESLSTSVNVSGLDLPTNGNYRVYYWFTYDNVGNVSLSSNGEYIRMDTSAPIVNWNPLNPLWIKNSQSFIANCLDAASGCVESSYFCTVDNHNNSCVVVISDILGNSASFTSPLSKIDRLAPNCKLNWGSAADGWFVESDIIQAECVEEPAGIDSFGYQSGLSGCKTNPAPVWILMPLSSLNLSVQDNAGNSTNCNTADLKLHYIEIRGLTGSTYTSVLKQETLNLIQQNVADYTRNTIPLSTEPSGKPNYNINQNIAYYRDNIILNDFSVTGKKTIIVKDGSLTLNGNITYTDNNSILGIIVLGRGDHGNVIIGGNVSKINGILFTEGTLLSNDQESLNQLYWKGSVISDNTMWGYSSSTFKCAQKEINCNAMNAKRDDLNFFRKYFKNSGGIVSDPFNKHAPAIIEYDSTVQQNIPFGFESVSSVSFQSIVK